jgi:hypothetical protein
VAASASCWWSGPPFLGPVGIRQISGVPPCAGRLGGEQAWTATTSAGIEEGARASSRMRTSLLQLRAHHMATKFVAMICGQQEGHFCCCVGSGYSTSMAEASGGDPCRRVTPPGCQVVCPRQLVAGGRHRSLIVGGEEPGLDRVWLSFPGFFLLFSRTTFHSLFFKVLLVNVPTAG